MAQNGLAPNFKSGFDIGVAMKNALKTHGASGNAIADAKSVLEVIDQKILKRAYISIDNALKGKRDEFLPGGKTSTGASIAAIAKLANIINKVSCELECKCSGGGNAQATTEAILEILENYSWDAKAVITLAAFAMNYGEFCLFAQLHLTNPLAKYVAILKHLPDIVEHGSAHQSLFGQIKRLMEDSVELAGYMVKFNDIDRNYISMDDKPLSNAVAMIHEHAYCIIFGVVACTEHIASIAGFSTESTILYQLSSLNMRIYKASPILKERLGACNKLIAERIFQEKYENFKSLLESDASQEEKLRAICNWGDSTNLVDCSGKQVLIEERNKFLQKTVLIFISSLEISAEEINAVGRFYKKWQKQEMAELQTQVLWLPVLEESTRKNWENDKLKFDKLRGLIPWYTIENPTFIEEHKVHYIKQDWKYSGKTILVALDKSGNVHPKSCLDMLWLWGDKVCHFTDDEEQILSEEAKALPVVELIFGRIDITTNFISAKEGKTVVCFYGGEDMEWIKKFTAAAKKIEDKFGIKLELTYVGKNGALGRVKKNIAEINDIGVGKTWDETSIWIFWSRMKSVLGRIDLGVQEGLKEEITTLLSLDANVKNGWALFYSKSSVAKAEGDNVLKVLDDFAKNTKTESVDPGSFVSTLGNLFTAHKIKHCNCLTVDFEIPEVQHCYCGRVMKKSYNYRCCEEEED